MFKCPYCNQDSYAKTSKKNGKFESWEAVRRHTSKCKSNTGEYFIDLNVGLIHKSQIDTLSENIKSNKRDIINSFGKHKPIDKNHVSSLRFNDEFLLDQIQEFYKLNKRLPTSKDFRLNKQYTNSTVFFDHFGSWNNALILAGFEPINIKNTDEELINKIIEFFILNKRIPTRREILPSSSIYQKRFGSWNKAIIKAGFEPDYNDGFGIRTIAKDGRLYRSKAEAYFVDTFLYGKHKYEYERKYDNHNKYYDFYLPDLNLYIELDGELRPQVIQEKIQINKEENKNLLVIKTKNIYSKKELKDFIKSV